MSWVNYHSHCIFCDGSDQPEKYIQMALGKGFPAYGFSSHAPLPFHTVWSIPEERFEDYIREINRIKQKYSDKIQVYVGLEADFIPGLTGIRKLFSYGTEMDYMIGSVHFIDSFVNGDPWSFDGSAELFKQGFQQIYHNNGRKMITRYYELVRQMITEDAPDIIGHLDKIKMHNHLFSYLDESDKWYKNEVEETLKLIKEKDIIVEINTRGYYKNNRKELLYPGEWILEKLYQNNIKVMINADTHHPDEVDSGFSYAAEILKKSGFKFIWALIDGKWSAYQFNSEGIKIR